MNATHPTAAPQPAPGLFDQFADYIAERWTADFPHDYEITTHAAWQPWRRQNGAPVSRWWCDSLAEAASRWSWTENTEQVPFHALARALQTAIAQDDNRAAEEYCLLIFKWGGVARKPNDASRRWVKQQAAAGTLCASLAAAVALLRTGAPGSFARFNSADLPMNSATTKLFAAADPAAQVVIYDGRVGAALALLSRHFLEGRGADAVPPELSFMWGASQSAAQAAARSRDPSSERHRYPKLPYGATSHRARAELSQRTNTLFVAVIARLRERGIAVTSLALERAMFMVGYRVR